MMDDAKFEDGVEQALRLKAEDVEDLKIISALTQDGVFPATEMQWIESQRRFALLLNRFRWEDKARAEKQNRAYERVQSLLVVDNVLKTASTGVDQQDKDYVLSVLGLVFSPGQDAEGTLDIVLSGDAMIRLDVECLDVTLKDVTKPYNAPSRSVPNHKLD